jgi:hypothetical protein
MAERINRVEMSHRECVSVLWDIGRMDQMAGREETYGEDGKGRGVGNRGIDPNQ